MTNLSFILDTNACLVLLRIQLLCHVVSTLPYWNFDQLLQFPFQAIQPLLVPYYSIRKIQARVEFFIIQVLSAFIQWVSTIQLSSSVFWRNRLGFFSPLGINFQDCRDCFCAWLANTIMNEPSDVVELVFVCVMVYMAGQKQGLF